MDGGSDERPASQDPVTAGAGHRVLAHAADRVVEAWGPDRVACILEALTGLVESFADAGDMAATRPLPLATPPGGDGEPLVTLFEDVINAIDVFDVVPIRFHLAETEDGGIAGDMEVVSSDQVELVGPVPTGVSYHDLSCAPADGAWRCHVVVDI